MLFLLFPQAIASSGIVAGEWAQTQTVIGSDWSAALTASNGEWSQTTSIAASARGQDLSASTGDYGQGLTI